MLHVALYQPAIPPNTGNIGRLCVGMNAALHLVGPIAFDLSDHALRRAGLDYWPNLRFTLHETPEDFLQWLGDREPWLITKFGKQRYDRPAYADGDVLILGNENTGIPDAWHDRWPDRTLAIPILGPIRAFNLANAAAIVLSHASLKAGVFDQPQPHFETPR